MGRINIIWKLCIKNISLIMTDANNMPHLKQHMINEVFVLFQLVAFCKILFLSILITGNIKQTFFLFSHIFASVFGFFIEVVKIEWIYQFIERKRWFYSQTVFWSYPDFEFLNAHRLTEWKSTSTFSSVCHVLQSILVDVLKSLFPFFFLFFSLSFVYQWKENCPVE